MARHHRPGVMQRERASADEGRGGEATSQDGLTARPQEDRRRNTTCATSKPLPHSSPPHPLPASHLDSRRRATSTCPAALTPPSSSPVLPILSTLPHHPCPCPPSPCRTPPLSPCRCTCHTLPCRPSPCRPSPCRPSPCRTSRTRHAPPCLHPHPRPLGCSWRESRAPSPGRSPGRSTASASRTDRCRTSLLLPLPLLLPLLPLLLCSPLPPSCRPPPWSPALLSAPLAPRHSAAPTGAART